MKEGISPKEMETFTIAHLYLIAGTVSRCYANNRYKLFYLALVTTAVMSR